MKYKFNDGYIMCENGIFYVYELNAWVACTMEEALDYLGSLGEVTKERARTAEKANQNLGADEKIFELQDEQGQAKKYEIYNGYLMCRNGLFLIYTHGVWVPCTKEEALDFVSTLGAVEVKDFDTGHVRCKNGTYYVHDGTRWRLSTSEKAHRVLKEDERKAATLAAAQTKS